MIERYIGDCAEAQLDHLITAIRQRWYHGSYGLEEMVLMEGSCEPWIPECQEVIYETMDDDFAFQMDPLDIPAVKGLVAKSTNSPQRKAPRSICEQGQQSLPLDLHLQILDLLHHSDV